MDCTTPQAALVTALGVLVGIAVALAAIMALAYVAYKAIITLTRNEIRLVEKEKLPPKPRGNGLGIIATWFMVLAIVAVIVIPTAMLMTRS